MTYLLNIKTDSSAAANTTHRLCVLDFKTPSDKKADSNYRKPASRCVSIPKLLLEVTPSILQDALTSAFEEMQDQLIRSIFTTALEASKDGNPIVTILDADISPAAVATYCAEKAISGKLSAEKIGAWFDAYLANDLELALANAMSLPDEPSEEQQKKLTAAISQHKQMLCKLAGPVQLPEKLATQLTKAVNCMSAPQDKIAKQLLSKLAPKQQDEMLAML